MDVEWAGWRSDTRRLQAHGWDLSVEYEPDRYSYRLALRHTRSGLYGLSGRVTISPAMANPWRQEGEYGPHFSICTMSSQIRVIEVATDLSDFQPIDANPFARVSHARVRNMEDYNIFAKVGQVQQVLVDKANMSVIEHLEAIKRLQSEKQRELRQKEGSRMNMVAQLVQYEAA